MAYNRRVEGQPPDNTSHGTPQTGDPLQPAQAAPQPVPPAIIVERLTKRFDKVVAVNDISFYVPRGEFFGFLGPNGAGKSTTIRVLCGLLRADYQRVIVAGRDRKEGTVTFTPEFLDMARQPIDACMQSLVAGVEQAEGSLTHPDDMTVLGIQRLAQ